MKRRMVQTLLTGMMLSGVYLAQPVLCVYAEDEIVEENYVDEIIDEETDEDQECVYLSNDTAENTWLNDYQYSLNNGFLIIYSYKGNSTELTIPGTAVINGQTYLVEVDRLVTSPYGNDTITKITFGKGVYFGPNVRFVGMKALKELDISGVDISGMTSLSDMFSGCENLKELDLTGLDTSNIYHMSRMFDGCRSLTKLDLSSFDTSKVESMERMFADCVALQSVNLESFSTENVENATGMFHNCQSLKTIDLSNFNLSNTKKINFTGNGHIYSSGVANMFLDSGIITLKTPYGIPDSYEFLNADLNIREMRPQKPDAALPADFVDQSTGSVYTDLPYGADGAVSHTLVRKEGNSGTDTYDNGKSNTFSKEDAIAGVTVIDDVHTLKLETDAKGLFTGAKIVKADGTVDTSVNSYIANIVTKYAADGTPEEFYSLIFRSGIWDTSYDTVKDGLYSFRGEQYSVAGGTVNLNVNSLTYTGDIDGWKYIILGHVVKNHAGLVAYGPADDLHWFWIDNEGGCDTEYNAIVKWNGADFLVHGGRLRTDYTGFTYDPQNPSVWYHITNGQVWGDGEITDQSIEGGEITRNCINGAVIN